MPFRVLIFIPLPPGVPSAPRNVVSVVNQTSVTLDWNSPRDTGHRDDLSYNVICRRCHSSERRACQPCDDGVLYVPGRRGLKQTRVDISRLRAHTSYTFEIQVGTTSGKRDFANLPSEPSRLKGFCFHPNAFAVILVDRPLSQTLLLSAV